MPQGFKRDIGFVYVKHIRKGQDVEYKQRIHRKGDEKQGEC